MPLPATWQTQVEAQLAPDETLLAWLETDLDDRLRFVSGMLALTDRRLLAKTGDTADWFVVSVLPAVPPVCGKMRFTP